MGGTRDVGALVYIVHSLYPEFVRPVAEGTGAAGTGPMGLPHP